MKKNTNKMLSRIKLAVFDFDGVFTNNRVVVSEDGMESVVCNRSDGLGIRRLEKVGVQVLVLSSEGNNVVVQRARKLQVQCISGVDDKLVVLKQESQRRRIPLALVAYVGNDINDIECMKAVGVSAAVADAWPEAARHAGLVLKRNGGEGAVREFCDMVWSAKKQKTFATKSTKSTK